jgi:hypothetical protein
MAKFGGFEIETPQEVIQRIRDQREKARTSRDPFVRRQANVDASIEAIFGDPQAKRQKRVVDAVGDAQAAFEEDENKSDLRNEIDRLKTMRDAVEDIDPSTATQINQRILELGVAEEEQARLGAESSQRIESAKQEITESGSRIQSREDDVTLARANLDLDRLKFDKPSDTHVVAMDKSGREFTARADDPRLDDSGVVVLGTADVVFNARNRAKTGGSGTDFSDSALKEFEDLAEKSASLNEIANFDFTQTGPIEGRLDAFAEFFGVDTDTTRFETLANKLKLSAQSALKGVPSDKDQSILDNTLPRRNLDQSVNRARTKLQIEAAQGGIRYKISEALANQGRIPSSLVEAARQLNVEPATVGTPAEELRRVDRTLEQAEKLQAVGNGTDGTISVKEADEVAHTTAATIIKQAEPLATAAGGRVLIQ